jgi:hypothetical protein
MTRYAVSGFFQLSLAVSDRRVVCIQVFQLTYFACRRLLSMLWRDQSITRVFLCLQASGHGTEDTWTLETSCVHRMTRVSIVCCRIYCVGDRLVVAIVSWGGRRVWDVRRTLPYLVEGEKRGLRLWGVDTWNAFSRGQALCGAWCPPSLWGWGVYVDVCLCVRVLLWLCLVEGVSWSRTERGVWGIHFWRDAWLGSDSHRRQAAAKRRRYDVIWAISSSVCLNLVKTPRSLCVVEKNRPQTLSGVSGWDWRNDEESTRVTSQWGHVRDFSFADITDPFLWLCCIGE